MSAKHTAVELWKTDYWRWRYSHDNSRRYHSRLFMRHIRREAALERVIARQQRSIELRDKIIDISLDVTIALLKHIEILRGEKVSESDWADVWEL